MDDGLAENEPTGGITRYANNLEFYALHSRSLFCLLTQPYLTLPRSCQKGYCLVQQAKQERREQHEQSIQHEPTEVLASESHSKKSSLKIDTNSPMDIDIDIDDDTEEKTLYSPNIEYSSIYSLFGSVLGLSSVFGNNSIPKAVGTTLPNVGTSGSSGPDDRINVDESPSLNELNEDEIRFDTTNPLLRVKSHLGLSRLVISSHATITSSHCSFLLRITYHLI